MASVNRLVMRLWRHSDNPPETMEENLDMPVRELLRIIQQRTFHSTYFGVPSIKNPIDFWIYQETIFFVKPMVIIEIGTKKGGTTLALAHLLDSLGQGKVISIDRHSEVDSLVRRHPRIFLVTGDACARFEQVKQMVNRDSPVLIIEDSSHTYDNTLNVLRRYSPLVTRGSYFIVEDGICHHGLDVGPNPGPYEAVEQFLKENNSFEVDRSKEPYLITWNPKGYLRKM